ncbi:MULTISPECIES: DUF3800 domain-containing protein [unclassified Paraburkholderia]|uniref:DUF3800 domain-containing protein n=1 Tax=unclassified Paraburkholderia TaxID=2615204 RepID=UPI002AB6937F|nr:MULTISPECIES: DUF3800 domain-containing protein [unclassified Paraburkholderia]
MPQKIYFDESGFTGNNLLHPEQKYFSYASVATDDQEAKEFVERLIATHGIQGGELKGSKLVRFSRGRKLIDEIFDRFDGRIKISISDKKFALACKLHEYIFEPCFSEINSLFYGIGFHRFIANILYVEFVARGAGAEAIFTEFEELMRTKDESKLHGIFSSSVHEENSPVITQIREFAQHRAEDIRAELSSLDDAGSGKWILDLTNTALFTLLANWGMEYDQITAVCDPSKPLQHDPTVFETMIGREDRLFSEGLGERHPITFNLSGPIEFADSKLTHGIQIADAVAAAAVYVFSGADDEHAVRWRKIIARIANNGSIIPDRDEVRLKDRRVQRNALVLMELHSRAKAGKSLVEGMPEYLHMVSRRLITDPMRV